MPILVPQISPSGRGIAHSSWLIIWPMVFEQKNLRWLVRKVLIDKGHCWPWDEYYAFSWSFWHFQNVFVQICCPWNEYPELKWHHWWILFLHFLFFCGVLGWGTAHIEHKLKRTMIESLNLFLMFLVIWTPFQRAQCWVNRVWDCLSLAPNCQNTAHFAQIPLSFMFQLLVWKLWGSNLQK